MFFLQLPTVDIDKLVAADSVAKAKMEDKIISFMHKTPQEILQDVISGALDLMWKIVVALIVYYIGRWIIKRIKKVLNRIFDRRELDSSLRNFLINVANVVLTVILVIIIVDILGLNTTGIIAIFASAGLAVGMALSGTLQNFAGGVMLLLLKPYKVGDYIDSQGFEGTVQSIQLFSTIITTTDNKTIIIPNGPISTNTVKNFTRQPTRRIEWHLPLDYGDDFAQIKAGITGVLRSDKRIIQDLDFLIAVYSFEDSYVTVRIRAWTASSDFWDVFYDMNARFMMELPEKNINFPYPHLDVKINRE